MAQNPLEVLNLRHKSYPGNEPTKNPHIDPVYALLKRGKPRKEQTEMAFYTDTSICIGCKGCEVACKQWNQLMSTRLEWSGNSYDNTYELNQENWRHVKFVERFPEVPELDSEAPVDIDELLEEPKFGNWLMMSDQCKHCQVSPCQEACPTGAIIHNEYGGIYYQTDICMGCTMCVAACPFGVPQVSPVTGHSMKCAECYDRLRDGLTPACALACTTQSIHFGPRDEMVKEAKERVKFLHEHGYPEAYLYGAEEFDTYSPLNSFYLLMDKPEVYGLPEPPVRPVNHMVGDYAKAFIGLAIGVAAIVLCLI